MRTRIAVRASTGTAALALVVAGLVSVPAHAATPTMLYVNDPKSYEDIHVQDANTNWYWITKGKYRRVVDAGPNSGESGFRPYGGSYRVGEIGHAYGPCTWSRFVNPPSDWRDNGTKVITYRTLGCTN